MGVCANGLAIPDKTLTNDTIVLKVWIGVNASQRVLSRLVIRYLPC